MTVSFDIAIIAFFADRETKFLQWLRDSDKVKQ